MIDPRERELEAALQHDWDDDTAAVYADLLTARGDPHGELIAVDLALARGITNELLDRKRELLTAWLGDQGTNVYEYQHGFVRRRTIDTSRNPIDDAVATLFATFGDRIRDLTLYGTAVDVKKGIAALATRPLPWLRELQIHRAGGGAPIDHEVWGALIAATPNLRTLTLVGEGVVVSPVHPAIRTLRLQGPALAIGRAPVAGVTELELTFVADRYQTLTDDAVVKLAALVNPRAFPALRILDLSSNRPPQHDPITRAPVLAFLGAVEHLDRFERVRVPAVADVESAWELVGLVKRCPHLSIEVARMYTTLDVAHPRLRLPPPRAWPASAHSRDALDITVAPGVDCSELALSSLIDDLEGAFDAMRVEAQQAWLAVWKFLDDLPWEDDQGNTVHKELPAATLLAALEALDGENVRATSVATAIRTAKLPPGATVTVSRYWGW